MDAGVTEKKTTESQRKAGEKKRSEYVCNIKMF